VSRRAASAETLEGPGAAKPCARCGRTLSWRKKWARSWSEVRFCSDACRAHKVNDVDTRLEQSILQLLHERARGQTICPSEAARAVVAKRSDGSEDEEAWRALMEPARQAARRLVANDQLDILQRGVVVDGSTAKGPIRLRLRSLA
jgi:hypothetical protein